MTEKIPSQPTQPTQLTSYRIPVVLKERLARMATLERRSRSMMLVLLLEDALDRAERRIEKSGSTPE